MTTTRAELDAFIEQLSRDAAEGGYYLNPDVDFVRLLAEGLLTNRERYGYLACPCRLASGDAAADLDLVCPCDYRDPDLDEFETCYCALYVSAEVARGEHDIAPIPDRRPDGGPTVRPTAAPTPDAAVLLTNLPYPVWRCKVCGYLCARTNPPGVCPVCKATRERFERFI